MKIIYFPAAVLASQQAAAVTVINPYPPKWKAADLKSQPARIDIKHSNDEFAEEMIHYKRRSSCTS